MRRLPLIILIVLFPTCALAHPGGGDAPSFMMGLVHPFQGLDHIAAMIAVGAFAAVAGGRSMWLAPLGFVSAMVAGFLLARTGYDLPFVELGIAASGVVLAAAAMFGRVLPSSFVIGLIGLFAVLHGHAHGTEMAAGAGGAPYALGFVIATAVLHLAGMAAVRHFGREASRSQTLNLIAGNDRGE